MIRACDVYRSSNARRSTGNESRVFVLSSVWDYAVRTRFNRFVARRWKLTLNEDTLIDCPHSRSVPAEILQKHGNRIFGASIAATPGQNREFLARGRQRVSLRSVLHLQPMLDDAKEGVRGRKLNSLGFGQVVFLGEPRKHDQRLSRAHPRLAPAVLELKRLRYEFNLANPARSELHVKASAARGFLSIDLLFLSPNCSESGRQSIPHEDQVALGVDGSIDHRFAAGGCARSDQRLTFPVVSVMTIVVHCAVDLPNQVAISPVGPQPEIYSIDCAFTRASPDHPDYTVGKTGEEFFVAYDRFGGAPVPRGLSIG